MKKKFALKNVIIIILITIFCVSFIRQELAMKRIKETVSQKQEELEKLKEQNDRLKEEVESTNTDTYIEKMARERLGMIKEGEKVVIESKDQ